jgi:D-glycero-D-manno-heptose 1,7-bisphosphate phosphatase
VTLRPGSGKARRPAVFLDRDGTIIKDVGYLSRLDDIELLPGSIDAIRALNRAALPVIVITNQSGIARGYFTEEFLADAHRALAARAEAGGARIDAFYYCPHHARGTVAKYATSCECRKPGAELLRRAAADLSVDLSRSYMVGDKWLDVGAGRAAGAQAILVRSGFGWFEEQHPRPDLAADAIVDNLAAAASWILLNRLNPPNLQSAIYNLQ